MEWVTTSTIVQDLRDFSNRAAWHDFVDRFGRPIVRFVRGMGFAENDAEDVCQETLAAFAESLRAGRYDRGRGRLRSWLFGIAYKQALRHKQKARRRGRLIDEAADAEKIESLPDEKSSREAWNTLWERFLMQECLGQIRREFRPESVHAFELIVREGCSAAEAATRVGVTTRAVYNAKHRILKRMRELRSELEEVG